jgi:two-component system response regulator VanR
MRIPTIETVTKATPRPAGASVPRWAARVGCACFMPPVKPAARCQHVSDFPYTDDMRGLGTIERMRVLVVEDEPYMAEAIRDGLRLEAIAADIAGDGDTAFELLSVNAYDVAVLDRDIPGPSGDEVAQRIVASDLDTPILMLTAADRLDDKASGFELGADDYLTKPFELRELVLRLRALDRRRGHNRPPVREIGGLRLDPFRREVYRDDRYIALTRKQFAVLEILVAAEGGVVSAEELLARAWDENADPFTNAVRITVSALRKRLGEPWLIATVPGVGYRIVDRSNAGDEGGDRG